MMHHGWRGLLGIQPMRDKGPDLATSTLDHSVSGIRQPLKRGAAPGDTPRGQEVHSRANPPIGSQDRGGSTPSSRTLLSG